MTKAKLTQMHKQLETVDENMKKKESVSKKKKESTFEAHVPRGERADFLKTSITIPCSLLAELRAFGMKRKAMKLKDTDTSSLIREAIVEFLDKHKDD
jgi:hypothetical protein